MHEKRNIMKENKIIKKQIIKVVSIIIVAMLMVIGVRIGWKEFFQSDSQTTKIGFEDIGELATQEAFCEEVNVMEASRKLFGVDVPFTQSKYIYSYNVKLKAGFDFGDIKWNIDDKKKQIEVKLPEIRTLSSEVDWDSFKVYHEKESKFRSFTLEETNEAQKEMVKTAEEDAIANGLYENARKNAEVIITGFFTQVYDMNEYEITYVEQ